MKRTLITLVAMLALTGCIPATYQPAQVQEQSAKVADVSIDVAKVTDQIQAYAASLAESQDGKLKEIAEVVQGYADKISQVSVTVSDVSQAVAEVEQSTDDKFVQTLELIRAANTASAPVNPYAGPVEIGLAALTGLAGMFAAKKSKDAKVQAQKYAAHKQGVEKTMKEMSAADLPDVRKMEARLYENIGEARKSAA